jgi:methyltransferase family protein
MSAEDQSNPTTRAAELYAGGHADARAGGGPLRRALRRLLLRVLRPYTHHQRVLDGEIVRALQGLHDELDRLHERDGERLDRLEHLAGELIATAEALRRAGADAARDAHGAGLTADRAMRSVASISDELHAPPYMEGEPFVTFDSPVGEVVGFRAATPAAGAGEADDTYVAFEDIFRGSAERVAESQRAYLPLLRDSQPVLDVGCGRGEMLALLAAEGIAASGVDIDAGMVHRCRQAGLSAVQADANAHLGGLADGAVFSAQVIEHMPYGELRRLLAVSRAKLRPGGLFIAETVNPHRISSLKTFWVDPTHQHPIFPEVALALCAIAGFACAYVFTPGFASFEQGRLQAPAYAVVATAGAADASGEAD